jgi:hypothetical protein
MRVVGFSSQFRFTVLQSIRIPSVPNKSPEPTPTAVTPRAIEGVAELEQMNPNRFEARGAPAVVVAHL